MAKIEGYAGICAICFEPISEGEEIQIKENGRYFHKDCTKRDPENYYLFLEHIRAQFEQGTNPTYLMNEMERVFKVPALNDPVFNEENEEVIKLYREIGDSRDL